MAGTSPAASSGCVRCWYRRIASAPKGAWLGHGNVTMAPVLRGVTWWLERALAVAGCRDVPAGRTGLNRSQGASAQPRRCGIAVVSPGGRAAARESWSSGTPRGGRCGAARADIICAALSPEVTLGRQRRTAPGEITQTTMSDSTRGWSPKTDMGGKRHRYEGQRAMEAAGRRAVR